MDRQTADKTKLQQRAPQRQLPLFADPRARSRREHCLLRRRKSGAAKPAHAFPPHYRQPLAHRLPLARPQRFQFRHHSRRAAFAADVAGTALFCRPSHHRRHAPNRAGIQPPATGIIVFPQLLRAIHRLSSKARAPERLYGKPHRIPRFQAAASERSFRRPYPQQCGALPQQRRCAARTHQY